MTAQYASVYILDVPYAVDRAFDYFIPTEMRDKIREGCFATVPFGGGNRKRIAIVTGVSETCGCSPNLVKPLTSLCSDDLFLEPQLLRLAFFMREQTLCTMGEAVHAMIPAAAFSSLVEYYKPTENEKGIPQGRDKQLIPVLSYIREKKNVSETNVKNAFGASVRSTIGKLTSGGFITREMVLKDAAAPLTESVYSLAVSLGEAEKIATHSADAKMKLTSAKQTAVLKALLDIPNSTESVTEKELIRSSGAARVQIKALVSKGLVTEEKKTVYRNPYSNMEKEGEKRKITLNGEQSKAFDTLKSLAASGEAKAALLHGITGSGKTSVMLALIDEVLAGGKNVILLLPEISLTPQTISIFCSRYGNLTTLVHSGLSAGERYDAYRRIKQGEARVIIGTRSAVFSPVNNLGLIVIDEEQEQTYKSDQNPKYHARDVARYRCTSEKALMLLASATPSLESYQKALTGKYTLIKLKERYGGAKLPGVTVADMRGEAQSGNVSPLGTLLTGELNRIKSGGEQSILFLNRRGYNTFISCRTCGEAIKCPNCSVSMTYHTHRGTYSEGYLVCHWCGYRMPMPEKCPSCGSEHLSHMGYGTQRVEQEISELVPDARVLRMDTDTTSTKNSYDELLGHFRRREADILLGTQMVTKGHDFPGVTLVGVLLADASLYLDDYRASERTFAMLTQVIGRAGRACDHGEAVIQTNNPDNDVIKLACAQDYETFYEREIKLRKLLVFPPFCDIVLMTVTSKDERELFVAVRKLADEFSRLTGKGGAFSDVANVAFGPFEAPVYKVDGKCRMRMVIKCRLTHRSRKLFATILRTFSADIAAYRNSAAQKENHIKPYLAIDFNPSSL